MKRIEERLTKTLLARMREAEPFVMEEFGDEFKSLPIDRRIPILIQVVKGSSDIFAKSKTKVAIDLAGKLAPWIIAALALMR